MHRIDADANVANHFSDGNPATGTPGTKIDTAWLNAIQEELANLIEGAGITLVKGTNTQLLSAAVASATANRIVRRDASGRAQFATPAAAADAATMGYVDGSTGVITASANWSLTAYQLRRSGKIVTGSIYAAASNASANPMNIAMLPSGFLPETNVLFQAGLLGNSANGFQYMAHCYIQTDGKISLLNYDNGTQLVPPFAMATACWVYYWFTFIAA